MLATTFFFRYSTCAMRNVSRDIAAHAQRTAHKAIADLVADGKPISESKALTISELINSIDKMQARLVRPWKRGKPHPKKHKGVASKPTSIEPGTVLGIVRPEQTEGPDQTPDQSSNSVI